MCRRVCFVPIGGDTKKKSVCCFTVLRARVVRLWRTVKLAQKNPYKTIFPTQFVVRCFVPKVFANYYFVVICLTFVGSAICMSRTKVKSLKIFFSKALSSSLVRLSSFMLATGKSCRKILYIDGNYRSFFHFQEKKKVMKRSEMFIGCCYVYSNRVENWHACQPGQVTGNRRLN